MRTTLLCIALSLSAGLLACGDKTDDTAPDTTEGDTATDTDTDTDTDCASAALQAVEAIAGTYEGSWTMYGLDASDESTVAMTWTDVSTATDPTADDTRAWASVLDIMDTDQYGQMESEFIEGYMIEDDCSVGVRFMEMDGVVTEMPEIEDGHSQWQTELNTSELWFYENVDTTNLVSGYHTTDKLVSYPDGLETHEVTRTTHIEYTSGSDTVVVDFVSMEGSHQKTE